MARSIFVVAVTGAHNIDRDPKDYLDACPFGEIRAPNMGQRVFAVAAFFCGTIQIRIHACVFAGSLVRPRPAQGGNDQLRIVGPPPKMIISWTYPETSKPGIWAASVAADPGTCLVNTIGTFSA